LYTTTSGALYMNTTSLRAHHNLLFIISYLEELILNNTQRLLSFDTDLTQ